MDDPLCLVLAAALLVAWFVLRFREGTLPYVAALACLTAAAVLIGSVTS